ncbi:MAG: hypothetical protein ACI4AH_02725 [Muribaculaceae bacterium]
MKRRNYIGYGIVVVLTSVVLLLAMHRLPPISILGVELREVDMLSELRDPDTVMFADTVVAEIKRVKPAYVDSCPEGVQCIVDYSDDCRGMVPLYNAMSECANAGGELRIAVLGDSFIEGDIVTDRLRELLQKRFGGCGVGFVPVVNEAYGFRRSVIHHFDGWSTYSAVAPHSYDSRLAIISGQYFIPQNNASVTLSGQRTYLSRLDTCQRASFMLRSLVDNVVTATVNGRDKQQFAISGSNELQQVTVNAPVGKVRFEVETGGDSVVCYGAMMDGARGAVVDNFALRASSGIHISNISKSMLSQYNRLRHYHLVIVMYGLNVANSNQRNYSVYGKKMCTAIEHMKAAMPGTGFLVISVGDREQRTDGGLSTMVGIKELMAEQQNIASTEGIAFWSLFDAMGGSGSIAKMVDSHPRQANLDYTHINHLGGKHLAQLLYDAIVAGYDNYLRRLAYENEE